MPIVSAEDIAKVSGLQKIGLGFLARFIMWITKTDKVNDLHDGCLHKENLEFIDCIFENSNVKYDYHEAEAMMIHNGTAVQSLTFRLRIYFVHTI